MIESMKVFLYFSLFFFVCVIQLNAQQSTHSTGGDLVSKYGGISYSIGQITYTYTVNKDGELMEGIQNPNEIFIVGLHETDTCISVIAYPNPTIDKVIIQLEEPILYKGRYVLTDINGKYLQSAIFQEQKSTVDMSQYVTSLYFLYVLSEESTVVQVFKIIKN